jgi:hypothetical protein
MFYMEITLKNSQWQRVTLAQEFEDRLDNIARTCLKESQKREKKNKN